MKAAALLVLGLLAAAPAAAQLVEPNRLGVRMGHVHLAVRDVEAHTAFWTTAMGGTLVRNGSLELIRFPGVFILLTEVEAPEPPAGSLVDHFGFVVRDMPAALARWRSAGIGIEPTENPNEVYVLAPDGIRVEVYGEPSIPEPVHMNHIHFYVPDIPAIKAWYVRVFGANPGRRPCVACLSNPRMIESGDLPGVNLSFSPSADPRTPTLGRALEHIGFEVADLEAFVGGLDVPLDTPIRTVPGTTVTSAFLTDPWGTRIELTEGLSPE